ncbi:MetQ/NlpA family ABC transporter substrate-binding protein [Nesterenkonia sp. LB17]|uniref:MetQ/NlpA family ABC transporter substrate-binding protein n=1 Tax=Nesterenkonia sp. LB17 TaxID=2901230 RepID=UPI001F4CBFC3|nr:MetQ/NlpA family ABC transporter substrate-binding protein [Nesterenkonia sp. LB17]MCH8564298.1 MetQ/NlpA family ABC transporter substrate-binding protein [Nesterenkonia sp. LB17]
MTAQLQNRPVRAISGAAVVLALFATAACSSEPGDAEGDDTLIQVASHTTPMTDVVEAAAEVAEEDGYTIELVEVSDNVQYNRLLADGEVDANFAQHQPYMEAYNAEHDAELAVVQPIYNARVGFYSRDYDSMEEIPDGAQVALPNDESNEGRALAILADQGLITLAEGVGFEGTLEDIEENPKDLEWVQVDLLNLTSAYEEDGIAAVFNYPTYIASLGLTPQDAIAVEENIDERFAISLVAREGDLDSEKIEALERAMTSDEVREFLIEEHDETLMPAF